MLIDGTFIEDTYAEAFTMRVSRLIITAESARWAATAARVMTGFATSVIGCGCEAGPEGPLPGETPDGRPGVRVLLFARNAEAIQQELVRRVGQCVMTSASSACFDDLPSEETVRLGSLLRFFGDGLQVSKQIEPSLAEALAGPRRRFWRIPVMDGEFLVEDRAGVRKGVAGGNFLILGETAGAALIAAERAVEAIQTLPGVILPFPGGIVRSGSKVGSKYKKMIASTNSAYCPTLRRSVATALPEEAGGVYEIVIDGLGLSEVERATAVGVRAACGPGVVRISAGNYGGKLGKHLIRLRPLLQ